MNCSLPNQKKPDWNAYALGELAAAERETADTHLSSCEACRDEVATLRLTLTTLATLREEEVPRRIAFVSDKVFEPRWWQMLWNPVFPSAAVVAVAIMVHGYAAKPADVSQEQIDAAVTRAVAQVQDRLVDLDHRDQQLMGAIMTATGMVRQ
jgi:anti-sigma factor RsiW